VSLLRILDRETDKVFVALDTLESKIYWVFAFLIGYL